MQPQHYDIAIIGGGMAGIATAYQLSQLAPHLRGVIVDRSRFGHSQGGSFGESRMFRVMHSDPYFTRMQLEALPLWRKLEQSCGEQLLKEHGLLFFGQADTGETVEGSIPGAAHVMQQLGMRHEYFSSQTELEARWPLKACGGMIGLFDPQAGSVRASAALKAMRSLAVSAGWQVWEGQAVTGLACGSNSHGDSQDSSLAPVTISLADGRMLTASQVVLAAGAWTNDLLALVGRKMNLDIWSMMWGHYSVEPHVSEAIPQWYCFLKEPASLAVSTPASHHLSATHSAGDAPDQLPATKPTSCAPSVTDPDAWHGGLYYGFPPEEPGSLIVKVGIDFAPPVPFFRHTTMKPFSHKPHARLAALLDSFLKRHWQGFNQPVDLQCSPYSMTTDLRFVLGRLPDMPQVLVFAGDCGRAFKFAPLLGRSLAELALSLPPSFDLSPLSPARPALGYCKFGNAQCKL